MKGGKGSRPSQRPIGRALIMLSLLRQREASKAELIAHVRAESAEEPYGENPTASFKRDRQWLERLGIEVRYDRQLKAYRLETESHPLWQLDLTQDEVETLAQVHRAFADTLYAEAIDRLVAHISQRLSDDLRAALARDPIVSLVIASMDDPETVRRNLALVESAMRQHRQLEFDYRSPRHPEPKCHVVEPDPDSVKYRDGHLYFGGRPVKGSQVLNFRVDRIVPGSARLLPRKFAPRERRARPLKLRYRLKAKIASLGASPRFREHTEEHLPNGDVVVTAETTADEMFWDSKKLLKYGENCEVLEPPALRHEMARVAREMARIYGV